MLKSADINWGSVTLKQSLSSIICHLIRAWKAFTNSKWVLNGLKLISPFPWNYQDQQDICLRHCQHSTFSLHRHWQSSCNSSSSSSHYMFICLHGLSLISSLLLEAPLLCSQNNSMWNCDDTANQTSPPHLSHGLIYLTKYVTQNFSGVWWFNSIWHLVSLNVSCLSLGRREVSVLNNKLLKHLLICRTWSYVNEGLIKRWESW